MDSDISPGIHVLRQAGLWRWLGIALGPFLLTVVVLTVFYGTVGLSPIPHAPTGVYAAMNVVVVLLLVRWLPSDARSDVLPYRVPTRREIGVSMGVALATIVVLDPVAAAAATALGGGDTSAGTFESALGAVVFGVSSIAVAPIVEEVLFRGLALDALRARYGVVAAIVGSAVLFGGIHLVIGGISGVVFSLLSGLVYAWMRVRYDNLTGVTVAHGLNNAYWVAVMLGVLPNVVPT